MDALLRTIESELPRGALKDKLSKRIIAAERHLERLNNLVEELLDVARLRTGRMRLTLERFDLRALVLEVANRHRDSMDLAKRELAVEVPDSMVGSWDRLRLDQVLTDLVSNAIKYGAAGESASPRAPRTGRSWSRYRIRALASPSRRRKKSSSRSSAERHPRITAAWAWASTLPGRLDAHGGTIAVDSEPGRDPRSY